MLHVQVIVGLGSCYDSARKFQFNQKFFLKTKSSLFLKLKIFFFSLLCIVHINLVYQNVIPLPMLNMTGFTYIQNSILYLIYAIVTLINPETLSTYILWINENAMKIEKLVMYS